MKKLYHQFMVWKCDIQLKFWVTRARYLCWKHGLPSLKEYSDDAIIAGFVNLAKEQEREKCNTRNCPDSV